MASHRAKARRTICALLEAIQIGIDHQLDQVLEARLGLPAKLGLGQRVIALQIGDLGGPEKRPIAHHVLFPVEPYVTERDAAKLSYRVRRVRADNVVLGRGVLQQSRGGAATLFFQVRRLDADAPDQVLYVLFHIARAVTDRPDDAIPLLQEQVRQVGTILRTDADDESGFTQWSLLSTQNDGQSSRQAWTCGAGMGSP